VNLTVRQASIYVAATLIDAALHFFFAGLPLSSLPLNVSIAVYIQPSVVVPIFVGLTAGPLGGGLVGLAGRMLGDWLAGQALNGFGLIYSGVLGLTAGLGYRRLSGYSNLRQVVIALSCAALACVAASLVSTLLVQTLIWRDLTWTAGLNRTLSQIVSGGTMALLLISTPLYVWGRTRRVASDG
jgi:uncharacterized membrane protein